MQHFLKAALGTAGTEVLPAQFLEQVLVGADDPEATFDMGFRGIAFAAFTITGMEGNREFLLYARRAPV
jgi:hypothetical protein